MRPKSISVQKQSKSQEKSSSNIRRTVFVRYQMAFSYVSLVVLETEHSRTATENLTAKEFSWHRNASRGLLSETKTFSSFLICWKKTKTILVYSNTLEIISTVYPITERYLQCTLYLQSKQAMHSICQLVEIVDLTLSRFYYWQSHLHHHVSTHLFTN